MIWALVQIRGHITTLLPPPPYGTCLHFYVRYYSAFFFLSR